MKVVMAGVGGYGWHRRVVMRRSGLYDIVGVYDWKCDAAAQASEEEGGAEIAGSYDELVRYPGAEAVVISTGAKYHAAQVISALERGLHVFVEKPLCSTAYEIRKLIRAQEQSGLVVSVGHADHSTSGISVKIKNLIDSGKLGKVVSFEKTTAHSGGFHIKPGDWRGDKDKNPGGMLFQCGVHAIHELMYYFGPVEEVSCTMRYDVHTTETADAACCILKFECGLIGTLNAYHVTPYRHSMNIFGSKASLYRNDRYFDEGTKILLQRMRLDNRKEELEELAFSGSDSEVAAMKNFHDAVRKGKPNYPSLLDGARCVAVVLAAEKSAARNGKAVKISEIIGDCKL